MRDKDGFEIRCIHSDWKIIDNNDNHDYVCCRDSSWITGYHYCYCDEHCKYYKPDIKEETDK